MPRARDVGVILEAGRERWDRAEAQMEARSISSPDAPWAARFANSATYRHGLDTPVVVATAAELAAFLASADLAPLVGEVDSDVVRAPRPARVPGLVTTVPVPRGVVVRKLMEALASVDGLVGAQRGEALAELSATFDAAAGRLRRWGVFASIDESVADQPQLMATVVDRLLLDVATLELEADVLAGDGTETAVGYRLTGIAETDGVDTLDATAFTRALDALATASGQVGGAGYFDTVSVVAAPETIAATFADAHAAGIDLAEALPLVEGFVPTTALEGGTAIIGAFASAFLFVAGDLSVTSTSAYEDYLRRGLSAVRASTEFLLWVPRPSAFVVATGLPGEEAS